MEIRVRYSGLVIFSSRIVSILTGLVFFLILTRSLSTAEFGVWSNIGTVLISLGIASTVFPYWAARYTARGFNGAMKLGLIANLIISVPVFLISVLVAPAIASAANAASVFYVYAGILAVQAYVINALDAVVSVVKTHTIGKALLFYELIKVLVALLLVTFLHFGLLGALSATFVANLGWIAIYTVTLKGLWAEKTNLTYAKQWIKGSFLNFYGAGAGLIASLEGYLLLFLGGIRAVAYFGAATIVSGPIGLTTGLSAALYPKLLAGGTSDDILVTWRTSLLFSLPLTLAVVALSPSLLAILGADYAVAHFVLALLAFRSLAFAVGAIFDAVIGGSERLDAEGQISVRRTVRSRLFQSLSVFYAVNPIFLPILWLLLQLFGTDPLTASEITALMSMLKIFVIDGLKYLIARRCMPIAFPVASALRYLIVSTIIVSPTLFLVQPLAPLLTLALFFLGAGLYFTVLYFIDADAHELIRSILGYGRNLIRL